jgi:hypothetical protein
MSDGDIARRHFLRQSANAISAVWLTAAQDRAMELLATMTIQALAFRAAEHAARMAKQGQLT